MQLESFFEWVEWVDPVLGLISFVILLVTGLIWAFSPKGRLWLLTKLTRLSRRFDKPTIGQQCAVFMKPRIHELNDENPEATLPLAELRFTRILSRSGVFVGGDGVIIVLKDSRNKARNLLRIAEEFISQGAMHGARRITDGQIRQAVNVVLIYRLLTDVDAALRLWDEEHYQPCLSDESMRKTLEMISYLDKSGGYLTRVFLPELELVARRVGIGIHSRIIPESRKWLEAIHNISLKHHEDPAIYTKEYGHLVLRLPHISVGFVLIAKSWRIAIYDTKFHEGWVIRHLNDPNIKEIYIIGWTEENCYHAMKVVGNTYLRPEIAEVWPTMYRIKSRGQENIPIVLVRYIKGPVGDEQSIRQVVRDFQKKGQKELKRMYVTRRRVLKWFEKNGPKYIGTSKPLQRHEAEVVAKVIDDGGMTIEVLDHVFEDSMIQSRFEDMLTHQQVDEVPMKDQVLYRIYVAMGFEDKEIMPRLDPMVFMSMT